MTQAILTTAVTGARPRTVSICHPWIAAFPIFQLWSNVPGATLLGRPKVEWVVTVANISSDRASPTVIAILTSTRHTH